LFENVTGESLREGLKVLVKTKIEYHELYGLSLIISDIDPSFTIGEMAIKRQLIIKKLEDEGVFSMNKELEFPIVPQRIAVISSKSAAGYSDFINQLKGNSYGYVFYTALIETILQGTETEQSVIASFDRIALNLTLFDVVVIIRGGGSQSDLSWFDSYKIAYYVTQFPLPVITGIGHDKDVSVTDMVANRTLKTPTAVADFLVNSVMEAENHIIEVSSGIIDASRIILEKNRNRLETSSVRLFPLARIMLSDAKEKLSAEIIEIINTGRKLIFRASLVPSNEETRLASATKSYSSTKEMLLKVKGENLISAASVFFNGKKTRLEILGSALQLLNPEKVLQRGYSVTSVNGRIIKNIDQVQKDDLVETRLYEGSFSSRVVRCKEKRRRNGEDEKRRIN
jgi:exodeoxyribonuclease VII large subunit